MTPAQLEYQRCGLRLIAARARLLRQIARDGVKVADLLHFARVLGDETSADSLASFRAAQTEQIEAAEAELRRLPGPDPC